MLELDSMLFGDRPGRAFRSPDDTDRRGSSEGEAVDLTADVGFHIQRAISYCPSLGLPIASHAARFANVVSLTLGWGRDAVTFRLVSIFGVYRRPSTSPPWERWFRVMPKSNAFFLKRQYSCCMPAWIILSRMKRSLAGFSGGNC